MLLKILLLIGVIAAVYFIFFKPKSKPIKTQKPSKEEKISSDDMVACTKCGTYTAVDDAFIKNGQYYCSQECMDS